MKGIVFDLGGTLMQYTDMPASWVEFYYQGFEAVNMRYNFNVSEVALEKSVEILKDFNPRVKYREIEYSPEFIFEKALEHWQINVPMQDCVNTFYESLQLKAEIYPDTIPALTKIREQGHIIATLTDLPTAMPDELFRKDISPLLELFDFYVSSQSCGFRKPNSAGLKMTARKFCMPIEELIFVGDEEKDRLTALNANCRFVHIDRTGKSGGSIGDLYGLVELLAL